MSEPTFMQRLLREKALSRYLTALERGDIDTIIAILHQSSQDAILEQMIFELHETYQTEEAFLAMVQEEQEMDFKEGIHKSLPQEELDELQAAQGTPTPQPNRYARWFQALAAILLIVLLGGGVLLYTRLHASQTANSSLARWCSSPGAPVSGNAIPTLTSIAAVSPDDVWAVGNAALPNYTTSLIEHWNGKNWSVVNDSFSSPTSSRTTETYAVLSAVDALSANDVWAVGNTQAYTSNRTISQALVERWNGKTWQVMPEPAQPTNGALILQALSMTSDSDLWVIGGVSTPPHNATPAGYTQRFLTHWDGSHWSTSQLPPEFQNGALLSVKAVAPGDAWVSGTTGSIPGPQKTVSGEPLLAHWDGQSWTEASLPDNLSRARGDFDHLTALSANNIWASGSSYTGSTPTSMLLHWNGAQWTQMSIPTVANYSIYLGNLAVTATNSLWIAGRLYGNAQHNPAQMFVAQWNGQNWATRLQQTAGDKSLNGIAVSGSKVWVIGATYQPDSDNSYTILNPFIETTC